MRTREKKYSDYGLFDDDLEEIKSYCSNPSEHEKRIIMDAAHMSCPCIAEQLFNSLVYRQSYQTQSYKNYIPFSEKDFYAYRRKAMYNLRDMIALGL